MIIPYPTVVENVYVTSELRIKLFFLYYTRHGMRFHSLEKQIFRSFGCATTQNEQNRAETK